jgi:hypothetical protein
VDHSCEHENESLGELLGQLSDCHLLKNDSALWSLLGLTVDSFYVLRIVGVGSFHIVSSLNVSSVDKTSGEFLTCKCSRLLSYSLCQLFLIIIILRNILGRAFVF